MEEPGTSLWSGRLRSTYLEETGVKREEDGDETEDDKGGICDQIGTDERRIRSCCSWIRQKRFLMLFCHVSRA